jgi:hypothetical protein
MTSHTLVFAYLTLTGFRVQLLKVVLTPEFRVTYFSVN